MHNLIAIILVWGLLLVAPAYGWIMNIVNICSVESFEFSGVMIVQVIGIFVAPLGAVMGYVI